MPSPVEVQPYSIDSLKTLLQECSKAKPKTINDKLHRLYFEEYLGNIGVKTIITEQEYVDRDYLEDFAAYYVRCFSEYGRHCARLHFFGEEFTQADLNAFLSGDGSSQLDQDFFSNSYLGFIIIKPLPQTIVGRTCLRVYEPDGGRRNYPSTRAYSVNLFGIELTIDTLAFQEQDRVAAACATSALWSAFHGSGHVFDHPIPSPVNITRSAVMGSLARARALPSKGLNIYEMIKAVQSVGLEPHVVGASDPHVLRATAYAYLQAAARE